MNSGVLRPPKCKHNTPPLLICKRTQHMLFPHNGRGTFQAMSARTGLIRHRQPAVSACLPVLASGMPHDSIDRIWTSLLHISKLKRSPSTLDSKGPLQGVRRPWTDSLYDPLHSLCSSSQGQLSVRIVSQSIHTQQTVLPQLQLRDLCASPRYLLCTSASTICREWIRCPSLQILLVGSLTPHPSDRALN